MILIQQMGSTDRIIITISMIFFIFLSEKSVRDPEPDQTSYRSLDGYRVRPRSLDFARSLARSRRRVSARVGQRQTDICRLQKPGTSRLSKTGVRRRTLLLPQQVLLDRAERQSLQRP